MVVVQQKQAEHKWPVIWDEAKAFARQLVDKAGCPIDEGILEAVVALNLFGLHTCQSCEGHLDYGLPYPWIDFATDEFPDFQRALEDADRKELSDEEKEARGSQLIAFAASQTTHGRGQLYARLERLLCTYYEQHPFISEEQRFIIRWCSPILFRLVPLCGHDASEWSEEARAINLARAQTEMMALGKWLREQLICVQD